MINDIKNVDELESENVLALLLKYALPSILGTMVIALYNIIDSIYIGYGPGLGDPAITGLGIVLPVMNLIAAIGMLVGAGAGGRVSIYLGKKDQVSAEKIVGTSVVLVLLFTVVFISILYFFLDEILWGIGATEESFPYAKEFLQYYLPGNIFLTLNYTLISVMRSSGYPAKAMYFMGLGVIMNIILAPIFIFVFEWGMKGAAIATNISIFIGLCPVLFHFFNNNNALIVKKDRLGFSFKFVWSILSIGLSPFSMQLMASVVSFFINNFLREYGGGVAIGAYVIANRVIMVFILVIFGLTQGMQPIVGYNYGAGQFDRVRKTLNYAMIIGFMIGGVGLVTGLFFSRFIVKMFNPTYVLGESAVNALRIMSITLPLSGIQMVISNFFQSIGEAGKSFFLSMTRQFVILVPSLFLFSLFYKLHGVWISIPISDILSTILAIVMLLIQYRVSVKGINK